MSVNEMTKLTVSVLAFQSIFNFVHWYWCYFFALRDVA